MANLKKLQAQIEKLQEEQDKTYATVGREFCQDMEFESVTEYRAFMKEMREPLRNRVATFKAKRANKQSETEAHASNNQQH